MNIDQFIVLDAVARLGSFSAASRELNRVQSAVSYNIKTLEEELGLTIFSRDTYRPSLTPEGEAIYHKAKELLLNVEEIQKISDQLQQGQESVIHFDITPNCPISKVGPVLKSVAENYPDTRLQITMEVFAGEKLVLEGTAHISLTDVCDRDPSLEIVPWLPVPLIPVIGKEHPLAAQANEPLSRARMINHVQIVVSSNAPSNQDTVLGVMKGNHTWTVADTHVKKALILQGLGWGNLPEYLIEEELNNGDLLELTLPDLDQTTAQLQIVRRRHQPHGPVATFLWNGLLSQRNIGE